MKNLLKFKDYSPEDEYRKESRRELDLDLVRKTIEYRRILDLGFEEKTSHQQEMNNTMKFQRSEQIQKEKGHGPVFYTIHPSGTVRRYNPKRGKDIPEGSGNDIKDFEMPFLHSRDYRKALRYLWQYLKRKERRKDYR